MVSLRGLGWPQKNPDTRLERSDLSQTTPSSPAEIEVPSVQDLVGQLEAKEEQARRRSSVGDRPTTPNFRVSPYRPVILLSRTPSPSTVYRATPIPKELVTVQEEVDRGLKARPASPDLKSKASPLVFTTAEGETIYHPYALLPTPPAEGDDIGLDFNPHLPPSPLAQVVTSSVAEFENLPPLPESPFTFTQSPRNTPRIPQKGTEELSPLASPFAPIRQIAPFSPLNLAVDSAADSSAQSDSPRPTAASRPDTPLSFYRLDPSSAVTFNTSVRDLIQENPDTPIGGKPAAQIEDHTVRKMAALSKSAAKTKRPLKSRSNNSDSMGGPSRGEQQSSTSPEPLRSSEYTKLSPRPATSPEPLASPDYTMISPRPATPLSEASVNMVTAPDTPMSGRRNEYSDMSDISFDGPTTEVKDFAQTTEVTEVTEEVCPDCDLPTAESANASNGLSLPSSGVSPSGAPSSGVPSTGPAFSGVPTSSLPTSNLPASRVSPKGNQATNLPSTNVPPSGLSAPNSPLVPGLKGGKGLYVPSSNLSRGLAVPADITGQLDPPGTPVPSKKRVALGKGKRKGQKVVRRGRHLILRRPVLALVVGRQLAVPTSSALKLVSQGTPVDPTAFKDAAAPGLVPQPVPVPG